jgi:hypothetical protein
MSLVEKIKELCDGKNTTLAALERVVGLGQGTIRKWDASVPSVDKLLKISDYFGVSTDYLLENDKSKNTDIRRIERARNNMSPKDQRKMMKLLEAAFDEYFNDDFQDDDVDE